VNCDTYAEFLEAIGHTVIKTRSAYWFDAFPWTRLAFPYHLPIQPDADELRGLFRKAVLLRYVSESSGIPSHYVACMDRAYGLGSLNTKARNQTRKGLEHWRVERVECKWLIEHGLPLNRDTLKRQGRPASSFSDDKWRRYCLGAAGRSGFEAWAAVSDTQVGAVLLAAQMGDVVHTLLQRSSTASLRTCPNNALTFAMTQDAMRRPEVRMVFFGLRALTVEEGLDHFKQNMGYQLVPIRERFHPAAPVRCFTRIAGGVVRQIARRSKSEKWNKMEALLAHAQ
jgi:hypothetical protein